LPTDLACLRAASIAVVAGGFAAAFKLDPEFAEWFDEASCKNSTDFVGYEPAIKPEGWPFSGGGFPSKGKNYGKVKVSDCV
jgi:hypothetical protein